MRNPLVMCRSFVALTAVSLLVVPYVDVAASSSSSTLPKSTSKHRHCHPSVADLSSASLLSTPTYQGRGFLSTIPFKRSRICYEASSITSFQQYHDYISGTSPASSSTVPLARPLQLKGNNISMNKIYLRNNNQCHGKNGMILLDNTNKYDGADDGASSSFLSTDKARVTFQNNNFLNNKNSNSRLLLSETLSPMDQFLLALTSDRTSLLLGSIGIFLLLLNRLLTFPDDGDNIIYEASRSRIDLLGVFAAGSVLLNGITKLDVESVRADKVVLEGRNAEEVIWDSHTKQQLQQNWKEDTTFQSIVEWALLSYLKCTPAKTAVLLTKSASPRRGGSNNKSWTILARVGTLTNDSQIPMKTPILDRMFSGDNIKGGTVGGVDIVLAGSNRERVDGPKESYLPTLQALPGKVEFTYLPSNTQEALILPVSSSIGISEASNTATGGGWHYAVVLGGDVAKSFAPRDIAWCKEIASWIGELV